MVTLVQRARPSAGPLSQTAATSTVVPEDVLKMIETKDPSFAPTLVQTGQPSLTGNAPSGYSSEIPELPTYGVQQVPMPQVGGQDVTSTELKRLTPEEQMSDQMIQGERLAEPTNPINFNTPDLALNTVSSAIDQIKSSYAATSTEKSRRKTPDMEAVDLSRHASNLAEPLFNTDSLKGKNNPLYDVFSNNELYTSIENDLGLKNSDGTYNQENVDALGGVLTLAFAGTASDIRARKYKDSVEGQEKQSYDFDSAFTALPPDLSPEDKKKEFEKIRDLATSTPQEQPVITSFINSIGERVGKLMNRPVTPGGIYQSQSVSKPVAAALAYQFYQQGYFNFGKDRNGTYYPLLTKEGEAMLNDTIHAAQVYDVELRLQNVNEPTVRSSSNPNVANRYASKQDMFVGGKLKDNIDIYDSAATQMSAVGFTVDPVKYNLLQQMVKYTFDPSNIKAATFTVGTGHFVPPVNPNMPTGFSSPQLLNQNTFVIPMAYAGGPFNKSIADFSIPKVTEKVKELIEDGKEPKEILQIVTDINSNKATQILKHLNDYMKNNLGKVKFGTFKISDYVKRFFQTATDINAGNHGGTIRAGMKFGSKFSTVVGNSITQFSMDNRNLANRVYGNLGNRVFMDIGEEIQRRLWQLSDSERAQLDAYYQIAKYAHEFKFISVEGVRPTPHDFIMAMNDDALKKMAALGGKLKQWSENGLPNTDTDPALPNGMSMSDFFEKKEWGPKVDNAIMAYDIVNTIQKGGGRVTLDATIEHDASQSNAAIISLLIGDTKVANILGFYLGGDSVFQNERAYRDLRSLVSSSIEEDIDATITNETELDRREAIKKYFDKARQVHGQAFDKMYARGIVVAGLYGKSPLFMFSEVEDMFSKIGLDEEFEALENVYGGTKNRQMLIEDISSIYSTSMRKHLASLQGWQKFASGIASLKAALNGSSKIKGWSNSEIELGSSYATNYYDESNNIRNMLGLPEELSTFGGVANDLNATDAVGKALADIRQVKERLEKTNQNISDINDQLIAAFHAGSKARKALPVVLIQAGDAAMMSISVLYAEKGNKSGIPLNVYGIHDAQITAPGSTLLLHNSYNNIAPHVIASQSEDLLNSLYNSVKDDFDAAINQINKAGYANIGTLGRYKSMGGYFDRLYNSKHFIPRDIERGRKVDKTPYDNFVEKYRDEVLNIAVELGWVPPTKRNADKRSNIKVSPDQFKKLFALAKVSEGFLPEQESNPFSSLEKLTNEYNNSRDKKAEGKESWKYAGASRNYRALLKFKRDNKSLLELFKTNKNYIVNTK